MGDLWFILINLGPYIAVQVTLPPTAEQERATMIRQLEEELSQMPKVKPDSIDQIIKFGIEQNMLAMRSDLKIDPSTPAHVIAPGLRGYVRMTLLGPQDDLDTRGRNFTYIQTDLTDPQTLEITTISSIAGQINLARDGENDRYHWSIQLVQDAPPAPGTLPEGDPVRFLVHRDGTDQDKAVDLKLSGANFTQLRSQQTAAIDAYLRPILRDLKQEAALFAVPSQVAWQVLGTESKPDPKLVEQVRQLVARLDADTFRDRQEAAEQLRQLGQPAALALSKLDRGTLTLSQSSAVDGFLAEFAPVPPEQIAALARDRGFLLDVLLNDEQAVRELALKQLIRLTGKRIELDADPSARADTITKLRAELVPTTQPIER